MREALAQAQAAMGEGETPVGAVIVRGGSIIAAAHNRIRSLGDPTAHAESLAIREAARLLETTRLTACALYVTLEPCPQCAGAIRLARLREVWFGARDPRLGCCGSLYALTEDPDMPWPAVPAHGGLLESECAALLARCFAERRGRP